MPRLARIDAAIQRGRGKEAKVLGQTFDVYRLGLSSDTSGIVGPGSLVASNVFAEFERITSKADLEIELPGKVLHYDASLDMRTFVEGDVFVQRADSYKFDRLVFTCCSNRPAPRRPIFASTPIYATITRAKPNAQNVDSGIAPYSAPIKAFESVLTLESGYYEFAQTGTPATVPVGMVLDRLRDYPRSDDSPAALYDDTRRQNWFLFVPILPGTTLLTRDLITGANGDRFSVTATMPQYAGYTGMIVLAERIRN